MKNKMILQYLGNMAINGFIKYTNKRNNSTDRGWEERGGGSNYAPGKSKQLLAETSCSRGDGVTLFA